MDAELRPVLREHKLMPRAREPSEAFRAVALTTGIGSGLGAGLGRWSAGGQGWSRSTPSVWRGPLAITPTGTAPAGAGLAASRQFGLANQTDVFVVDNTESAQVIGVQSAGVWQGPLRI